MGRPIVLRSKSKLHEKDRTLIRRIFQTFEPSAENKRVIAFVYGVSVHTINRVLWYA